MGRQPAILRQATGLPGGGDAIIIAQYQRMTHYDIAGFSTAAGYAEALGKTQDVEQLKEATKEIYGGDEYMSQLSETVNADAKAA